MKPSSRWVYEDTGSKGRFTNSAAERSPLGCSEDPFSFKTGLGEIRAGELILWGSESFPNEAERLAAASMSFKTKTRASCSSLVIVGGSVKLDAVLGGCMKTLAPKGASRTPRLKEVLSDVLRIRSRLRRDSGKSGLEN
ncbi:hypothetical protein MRB53_010144 [Persea americana]|uniref:Uncharacterized protein n=1 Tax=Persea americana TaxID=3435 RepID=A0ACC2LR14_PERAE|nr:hypothetical protein MRB53_010144 [Persea americana]